MQIDARVRKKRRSLRSQGDPLTPFAATPAHQTQPPAHETHPREYLSGLRRAHIELFNVCDGTTHCACNAPHYIYNLTGKQEPRLVTPLPPPLKTPGENNKTL